MWKRRATVCNRRLLARQVLKRTSLVQLQCCICCCYTAHRRMIASAILRSATTNERLSADTVTAPPLARLTASNTNGLISLTVTFLLEGRPLQSIRGMRLPGFVINPMFYNRKSRFLNRKSGIFNRKSGFFHLKLTLLWSGDDPCLYEWVGGQRWWRVEGLCGKRNQRYCVLVEVAWAEVVEALIGGAPLWW